MQQFGPCSFYVHTDIICRRAHIYFFTSWQLSTQKVHFWMFCVPKIFFIYLWRKLYFVQIMALLFNPSSRCRHCMCPLSQRQYVSHIKLVHHAFGYDAETADGIYSFTNWTDYINEEGR